MNTHPLIAKLRSVAPSLAFSVHWSPDQEGRDIRKDCDGFEDEDPEDWTCWDSEVRVETVHRGELVQGNAYLGGTWEKAGDDPSASNPDISGYLTGMCREALEDLEKLIYHRIGPDRGLTAFEESLFQDAGEAHRLLNEAAEKEYAAQQARQPQQEEQPA